ncbi:MAG: glycosyltransferase [Sphingobacteriales bacterium]|jgi:glycosyltransferase involved in cell wall biosynthesis|nr:glycosyltransferase [Sphingobacteriales bacterium]
MAAQKIVLFGPGPQFKGGIANYNTSLAKALDKLGHEVHIVSWTQQYPAIIPRDFIDRKSKTDQLDGTNIKVTYITNYNNPATWNETVSFIKNLGADKVIFQWAIAIQGLPIGYICRRLKRKTNAEVIIDLHLVIQKEASSIDQYFSKYGLKVADTYIAHAYKTVDELKQTFPQFSYSVTEDGLRSKNKKDRNVIKLYHPIYDMFKPNPNFNLEEEKAKLGLKKHVLLFFGFIRKYKGLHQTIEAFKLLTEKRDDVSLLIVGESFWNTLDQNKISTRIKNVLFKTAKSIFLKNSDNEQNYRPLELLDELNLRDSVYVMNEFVPNEDVHRYFQLSDAILLYYLTATPSGVESISYNFKLPVLATKVGHFPETIIHGYNGYLAEDQDIQSMATEMNRMIEHPINRDNVAETASKLSWENYAKAITQ